VDQETELIIHTEIAGPGTESGVSLYNARLEVMQKRKSRPSQLILRFLPGVEVFRHLEEKLGMEFDVQDRLPMMESIFGEMIGGLESRSGRQGRRRR
jgi:hypothetical protein